MPELLIDVRKVFDYGIGTYIQNIVPRVAERLRGMSISLLGSHIDGTRQQEQLNVSNARWLQTRAAPLSASEQWQLRSFLKRSQVFWATSLAHPLLRQGPLIATVHDVAQMSPLGAYGGMIRHIARIYFESLRSRADLLLMVSRFTSSEFRRYLAAPRKAIVEVTPLGVDPSWFARLTRPIVFSLPSPYFLVLGSRRPHKNLSRVLEAFRGAMGAVPQALVIAASRDDFEHPDRKTASLIDSLGPRLHFAGRLQIADLQSVVASADALIFASLYEGFGFPVLEASAAGCLVVTTRTGAAVDICSESGIFVDPESVQSIRAGLHLAAALSPEERQQRIIRGIRRAELLTWEETADKTAEAIARVFHNPQARA